MRNFWFEVLALEKNKNQVIFQNCFFFFFNIFEILGRKRKEEGDREKKRSQMVLFVLKQKKEILQWPVSFKGALRQGCPTQNLDSLLANVARCF